MLFSSIKFLKVKESAVAGIRTRASSLEGYDPNQLDHNCLLSDNLQHVFNHDD